jgi:HD-like signal output (HDOD) protein
MSEDARQLTPQSLAAGAAGFATLPDVYARIRSTLDDPGSTHADVADVIGTDPALAARVLKIANSAFYGRPGTIARIPQAVGLLGTQQVHDLVLATVVIAGSKQLLGDKSALRKFWRLSVTLAAASKLIAEDCGILDSERVFVAGLISQLGQLVVEKALPEVSERLRKQAEDTGSDLAALQRAQFGFDHAAVAAELFEQWQLPPELIEPIRWLTQPSQAGDRELEASILNIAFTLAVGVVNDQPLDEVLSACDESAWQVTGLTRERLTELRNETLALTEDLAPILLDMAA